jgi:hypothetical protein
LGIIIIIHKVARNCRYLPIRHLIKKFVLEEVHCDNAKDPGQADYSQVDDVPHDLQAGSPDNEELTDDQDHVKDDPVEVCAALQVELDETGCAF